MNIPDIRLPFPTSKPTSTWEDALVDGPLLVLQRWTGLHFIAFLPSELIGSQYLHGVFLDGDGKGEFDRWPHIPLTAPIDLTLFTILGRITL